MDQPLIGEIKRKDLSPWHRHNANILGGYRRFRGKSHCRFSVDYWIKMVELRDNYSDGTRIDSMLDVRLGYPSFQSLFTLIAGNTAKRDNFCDICPVVA